MNYVTNQRQGEHTIGPAALITIPSTRHWHGQRMQMVISPPACGGMYGGTWRYEMVRTMIQRTTALRLLRSLLFARTIRTSRSLWLLYFVLYIRIYSSHCYQSDFSYLRVKPAWTLAAALQRRFAIEFFFTRDCWIVTDDSLRNASTYMWDATRTTDSHVCTAISMFWHECSDMRIFK